MSGSKTSGEPSGPDRSAGRDPRPGDVSEQVESSGDPTPEGDADVAFTLTELAAESEVSERTIRYYQSEKLLPRPEKRGRDAVYRPDHLERIRLIVDLRDRGLSLGTIRDLVTTDDPAATVAAWLGVDETLRTPWSQDRPQSMTRDQVRDLVAGYPAGTLGELVDAGFVRDERDGTWTVLSPALTQQRPAPTISCSLMSTAVMCHSSTFSRGFSPRRCFGHSRQPRATLGRSKAA